MTHRERMKERRERQLARTPGFDLKPSSRIAAAFMTALKSFLGDGMSAATAERQAWNSVARGLPPRRTQGGHRAPRPSKSDNPAYRKCAA